MTMADVSIDEDRKPGSQLLRVQPEITPRGRVWTQRIFIDYPGVGPSHTLLMIRDDGGDYHVDHGRIYSVKTEHEDGA
jgi:hypothetical protein